MRVCYLGDSNVQVRRVAEYFRREGHEVHLVTARPRPIEGVAVHPFGAGGRGVRTAFLTGIPSVRRRILELKPDLIHVFYATSYGLVSSFVPGPPVALSPMGSDVLISARGSRVMAWMVRRALARAQVVFSVAQHLTGALVRLGAEPERIHTFPRGVDLARFVFNPAVPDGRAPVILSSRNFEPVYNVEQLVRAAPKVLQRHPNAEFRVYGSGSLRDRLAGLARELGAGDKVLFPGKLDHDDIPAALARAQIYVSCSKSDGASASLLEAMAIGLYPVVSDIVANREWIDEHGNGRLVPVGDPDRLAAAINEAIDAGPARAQVLERNRRLIEERADWSRNMARMSRVYRSVAGR